MMDSSDGSAWSPTAKVDSLRARAKLLKILREFFEERGVLEVETPLLCEGALSHVETNVMSVWRNSVSGGRQQLYLQTSPEAGMKRLVAAGYGPIFQICKAFRDGEDDELHNSEFTMVEWYRPGWDHLRLIDEVDALLQRLLGTPSGVTMRYRDVFERIVGMDPFRAEVDELRAYASACIPASADRIELLSRDELMEVIVKRKVEPTLGHDRPAYLSEYPPSQACMARLDPDGETACRFEVFFGGVELGNGYHELTDFSEHIRRLNAENDRRRATGRAQLPHDRRFLGCIKEGLPDCAGVGLGMDRITMLAMGARNLSDVIAFPTSRA